jgi:ketosteroid isomerase-like protein
MMRTVSSPVCYGLSVLTLAGVILTGCAPRHGISEAELIRRTQQLYDAVAPGDGAPWQKFFSDDCMFFDEKGHNMNKKELVASIMPLPKGYSGSILVQNAKSHIDGNIAILSYDLNETETIYGQALKARYHETDTWMQRKGDWKIVAGQIFRYYEDPAASVMDQQELQHDPGIYELAPGKTGTISRDGSKLYWQRGTGPKVELIPEAGPVFFRKGVEGRMLFRHGARGNVDALIDRRNNEDVLWKRIQHY